MKTNIIECPACYHRMDNRNMLDEEWSHKRKPAADDFTVCSACGTLLRYDDNDVHAASDEELELMNPDQLKMAYACQEAVRSVAYQRMIKAERKE